MEADDARVNPDFDMSGELLCDDRGGKASRIRFPFKGVGSSDNGGRTGKSDELRYSFPNGLSRA